MKKAVIWCEVSCSNCGGVIGFDYRNAKTISNLKKKVKDWRYCEEEGTLCPDCYKIMEKEAEKTFLIKKKCGGKYGKINRKSRN